MTEGALAARVDALGEAIEIADSRYPAETVAAAQGVVGRARERLRHGSSHTVVALVGPTGSGKSSMLNRIAGADVSAIGVRRPTTSQTHSVSWGDDASALLDWLEITRRHHVADNGLSGLVLLDLPDFDSTETANRLEVDRLIELVDLLVWIVEPQKYADQSLHAGYLQPLAGHHEVMAFVLSKSDLLDDQQQTDAVADLVKLLHLDGIPDPQVVAASVETGQGIDALRSLVLDAVKERKKMAARLDVDLSQAAEALGRDRTRRGRPDVGNKDRSRLVDDLGRAVGVEQAASVAGLRYRGDAAAATGWPPAAFVSRLRRKRSSKLPSPAKSPVAQAQIGSALREFGDAVTVELDPTWVRAVRQEILDQRDPVKHALTKINAHTAARRTSAPRWWSAAAALQRVFGGIAAVGLIWLVVLAVVGGLLRLDVDQLTPSVNDWMPVPTLLLLAGLAVGLVVTVVSRCIASIGAKRHGRHATKALRRQVQDVADTQVISVVDIALDERERLQQLLSIAAGDHQVPRTS